MTTIPELRPVQFKSQWPSFPDDAVILLDVRETHEIDIASVPGTLHIPMSDIPDRLREMDRSKPTVVMCHSGMRSLQVARFLSANGFDQVYNLAGGIDAWSVELDASIPRY